MKHSVNFCLLISLSYACSDASLSSKSTDDTRQPGVKVSYGGFTSVGVPEDSSGITKDILSLEKKAAIAKYGKPKRDTEFFSYGHPEEYWEGVQADYTQEEIDRKQILVDVLIWPYSGYYDIAVEYHVKTDSISPRDYMIFEREELIGDEGSERDQ